ncbi:MAG TPA: DUF3822 family protein [Bacteroidia bacterium]|nr:DUF3822 family protein [Bacteroidia bacterium]
MNPLVAESFGTLNQQASIVDESFTPEKGGDYFLSVMLGNNNIAWSVLDRKRNKLLVLKSKPVEENLIGVSLSQLMKTDETLLGVQYRSVHVSVVNRFSTMIPSGLYEKGDEEKYFGFNISPEKNMLVMTDKLKADGMVNVFGVAEPLAEAIKNSFPHSTLHHFSTPLIEGILLSASASNEKKMFLHLQKSSCEIVVSQGKKLVLYNSFPCSETEECAYYVMFVAEQLKLNHQTLELNLLGDIAKDSAIENLLSQYIGNVIFGNRPAMFEYSYGFNDLPSHYYFPLISQHLCAS